MTYIKQPLLSFCCNDCAKAAKRMLKRHNIRMKLVPCDDQCIHYHHGITSEFEQANIILLTNGFSKDQFDEFTRS